MSASSRCRRTSDTSVQRIRIGIVRLAGADGARGGAGSRQVRRRAMSALAPSMQAYFSDRLIAQRGASPNTIAAYCQTCRLLLQFAAKRTGDQPSKLDIAQLDAPLIAAFLEHLEKARGTASAAATTVSRRSARCSRTWRFTTPSTPRRSSGCSRSRTSEPNAISSPTSPSPRSTPSSEPATRPPGPAA